MPKPNLTRLYYENASLDIPKEFYPLSQRHFRIQLQNGVFLKLNNFENRISRPDELRRYLLKYVPRHVYFSATRWNFPDRVANREHSKRAYLSTLITWSMSTVMFSKAAINTAMDLVESVWNVSISHARARCDQPAYIVKNGFSFCKQHYEEEEKRKDKLRHLADKRREIKELAKRHFFNWRETWTSEEREERYFNMGTRVGLKDYPTYQAIRDHLADKHDIDLSRKSIENYIKS